MYSLMLLGNTFEKKHFKKNLGLMKMKRNTLTFYVLLKNQSLYLCNMYSVSETNFQRKLSYQYSINRASFLRYVNEKSKCNKRRISKEVF